MSQGEHILVVDDDAETRMLFARRLEHEGYRVSQASDGGQAIERIADRDPDLVLLDIQMPGLNGLEVLTRVRAEHTARELPVIMATANQDDEMLERALALGANDYIVKPFSSRVLLARVKLRLADRPPTVESAPSVQVSGGMTSMEEGDVLDDKYRLGAQIGKGGYGAIFKATHLKLGRKVAIKLVRLERQSDDDLAAFEHEGVAACKVDHPNAVDIFDVGGHRRRQPLPGDGVPRGADAPRPGLQEEAHARAGRRHHVAGRLRARRSPRARHHPPRHQAREHLPRRPSRP
jgi:CheY-like chemotaxis protein